MSGRGIPTSPFEIEATKEIIARRIEAGDIKQSDLDLLKKGYRWMTTASFLGSIGMAIPTIIFMRRRRPPLGFGVKLLAAGGMGMLGSFLGFTVGGAAAAMEVNRGLENPQQKLKVFQEIAAEARRAALERSNGLPAGQGPEGSVRRQPPFRPPPPPRQANSTDRESTGVEMTGSTWSSEASLDRLEADREAARERSYGRDSELIRGDSDFARQRDGADPDGEFGTPFDRPVSVSAAGRSGGGGGLRRTGQTGDAAKGLKREREAPFSTADNNGAMGRSEGESTWDRLRSGADPTPYSSSGAGPADASGRSYGPTTTRKQERQMMQQGDMRHQGSLGAAGESYYGTGAGASSPSGGGAGAAGESPASGGLRDERSREQREFDEMLERERRGVRADDKWA